MSDPLLPPSVEQLISERIESVAQLEALLLMRRSDRAKLWSSSELASQLYIKPKDAADVLAALVERGLCVGSEGSYRYQPESDQLEADVDQLADAYRDRLILITNLIHSRAAKPAAQKFADVFRFRKDG